MASYSEQSTSTESLASTESQKKETTINGGFPLKLVSYTPDEMRDYMRRHVMPFCDDARKFIVLGKIGQGSFGEVFHAKYRDYPGREVAMKKIRMENLKSNRFPVTAFREIQILQQLKHDNVINLLEICQIRANQYNISTSFYLILELCEYDLGGLLLNSDVKFSLGEIKQIILQLLKGLQYIHGRKILHRDIKSTNILLTRTGSLKICDFGLSRAESLLDKDEPNSYTNTVVSLWYRPPELLLGDRNYSTPVDVWGVGCIMAEMWTRIPIMKGSSEQLQLTLISKLCGSITPEVWPKVVDLYLYNCFELVKGEERKVVDVIKPYVHDAFTWDLLDRLLILDPGKRIDVTSALNHNFFHSNPMPQSLSKVLSELDNNIRNFEYIC